MDYNKNYYEILEIDKNSSSDDIKKQYRKLSKIYHPDVINTGDEHKFKEINNAFEILSDPKLKQEYDQRSPHGKSYSPYQSFGSGFEFHFGGGGSFNDIFSQFFGGNSPFGSHFREEFHENLDVHVNVSINLKQIYQNENLNIKFKKFVHCHDCKGTGFDKNSHSETCDVCNGTGINKNRTCEYCQGEGKIYTGTCKTCHGEKVILKDSDVTIQNLFQLRGNVRNAHSGYGHQSKYYREKVGNLILNVNIIRTDDFQVVNNYELHKTIDVHFQDAIDGSELIYQHIDDSTIKIKLPEKTKNNDVVRIKEKGLLMNETNRSDLYLKINIIIDYGRI